MTRKYLLDLAERVLWTLAQALVAYLTVEAVDWDPAYAVPIAAALAVLKGLIAKHVGSGNTAATLPASEDTPLPVG